MTDTEGVLDEVVIPLINGYEISTSPNPGEFVSIMDSAGNEVFWDHREWQEDPVGVMGAIMSALHVVQHGGNLHLEKR